MQFILDETRFLYFLKSQRQQAIVIFFSCKFELFVRLNIVVAPVCFDTNTRKCDNRLTALLLNADVTTFNLLFRKRASLHEVLNDFHGALLLSTTS